MVSARTFLIQREAHTWLGLVATLALFVIFFCGALALFHRELEAWQEWPSASNGKVQLQALYETASKELAERPAGLQLELAPKGGLVTIHGEGEKHLTLSSAGAPLERRSRLGAALFHLHFLEPIPFALELSGLAALALLILLVNGLVIHWKSLPSGLWRIRVRQSARVFAHDCHATIGTLLIPFLLVFAWSGALLGLSRHFDRVLSAASPTAVSVSELRWGAEPPPTKERTPAAPMNLDLLLEHARVAAGTREEPTWISLSDLGMASGRAVFYFPAPGIDYYLFATLDAVSGAVIQSSATATEQPTARLEKYLHGVHFARWAGTPVRLLFAAFSLATCLMLIAGAILWAERIDPDRKRFAVRITERMLVALAGGLVIGSGLALLANRILPAMEGRAQLELACLWGGWALSTAGLAFFWSGSSTALTRAASISALLFGGALTLTLASLVHPCSSAVRASVIAIALLFALIVGFCAMVAWASWRRRGRRVMPVVAQR